MKLTAEQYEAVKLFHSAGTLVVNAFAGTGKTTTAIAIAESTSANGLYLAFNRSIADEIKVRYRQLNLDCRTTHSLAYRYIRSKTKYTEDKLFKDSPINFLVTEADLKDFDIAGKVAIKARSFAFLLSETIKAFCASGFQEINVKHVPKYGLLSTLDKATFEEFRKYVVSVAAYIWSEMRREESNYCLGHDGYLKLWSLASPELPYNFILLDEAQDTNDAVLSVLQKERNRVVYIGDRYQQIYSWRGAINAMSKVGDAHFTTLTQSFRFGDSIADLANHILERFGETEKIIGNPLVKTSINNVTARSVICRTNAGVLTSVVAQLSRSKKVYVMGGVSELRRLLDDVTYLKSGRPATNTIFFGFKDWKEVCEFADSEDGKHLQSFVRVIGSFGEEKLKHALDACVTNEAEAEIVVTTAHKAKGREWDTTEIHSDFLSGWLRAPGRLDDEQSEEEARLLYVAITRCKHGLVISDELLSLIRRERVSTATTATESPPQAPRIDVNRRPAPPSFIRER
jgi:superfamily I DNA/RNA helicase